MSDGMKLGLAVFVFFVWLLIHIEDSNKEYAQCMHNTDGATDFCLDESQ